MNKTLKEIFHYVFLFVLNLPVVVFIIWLWNLGLQPKYVVGLMLCYVFWITFAREEYILYRTIK